MIIRELYLKHFGKFTETRFEFADGIQVFYGENEYGKSTIYAFIKAMLFGLERGRGRAAQKDEFSRYEPWENPNYYAGMMRFSCGNRTFCLERQFDRYGKQVSLICEDDGEELSVEAGDLDMLLGEMSAASFENAAAIGQLTAQPGQGLAAELKNCAANYYETGSAEVDFHGTSEYLKERKKAVVQSMKADREMREREAGNLRIQQQYMRDELQRLEGELQESKEKEERERTSLQNQKQQIAQWKKRQQQERAQAEKKQRESTAGKRQESVRERENRYRGLWMMGVLIFAVGVFGSMLLFRKQASVPAFLLWGCIILTGSVLIGQVLRRIQNKRSAESTEPDMQDLEGQDILQKPEENQTENPIENMQQNMQQLQEKLQRTVGQTDQLRRSIQEKQIQLRNIQEQIEEQMQPDEDFYRLKEKEKAVDLAMEHLSMAAAQMTQAFGSRLNRETSRILAEITEGIYERVLVEDNLELSVLRDGKKIPIERLSRGTIEQVYFSLRMAVLNLLYPEEAMPAVFDDAFVYYDEKRLKSTLKWLSEQQRQVIIFSCQMREKEIIKRF